MAAVIQDAQAIANASTVSVTLPTAVSAHSALHVIAIDTSGAGHNITFSDSRGNTYQSAGVGLDPVGAAVTQAQNYALGVAQGIVTVTATRASSSGQFGLWVREIGLAGAVDGHRGQVFIDPLGAGTIWSLSYTVTAAAGAFLSVLGADVVDSQSIATINPLIADATGWALNGAFSRNALSAHEQTSVGARTVAFTGISAVTEAYIHLVAFLPFVPPSPPASGTSYPSYLLPTTPAAGFTIAIPANPSEDQALDLVFQALVAGVTGLNGSLVRVMWQNPPPKNPEPNVDWCAVGVLASRGESSAGVYIRHLNGPGINDSSGDLLVRHEALEVLASFYGPNAKMNSGILRDGLFEDQNREALGLLDIAFVGNDPQRAAPDFANQQWIRRWDLLMHFNRKVQRLYSVQNIVAAIVHIFDDSKHVDRTVTVPAGTVIVP